MNIVSVVMYTPVVLSAAFLVFHVFARDPGHGWF